MKTPVQFYFDFSSPYGYFGALRIDELAAKYGREVEWHPILLGIIFKTTQTSALLNLPLKGPYSRHDLVRTAKFHQIDFRLPTIFPVATHQAARAMLWIQNQHGKDAAKRFAKKVFQSFFVDDVNISEVDAVLTIGAQCGIDAQKLATGITLTEIKDQLKAEVDAALEQGIFGAPFVVVDGEQFWGFDRFYQIEALLKDGKI